VDGGPTLNPSTYELLAGIHEVPAGEVLVLPNSPNVVLAAERAAELSEKPVRVVNCTSPQAGLVALVELDPDRTAAENSDRLDAAMGGVRTGGIAPAARDDPKGRYVRGDAVGFVEDEIVAWGGAGSTLAATIGALGEEAEIITVVEGEGAPIRLSQIPARVPEGVELELQRGGQPHWWWLLAAQ
jgi:dihydroxyacetone kinase-like predicted kinase